MLQPPSLCKRSDNMYQSTQRRRRARRKGPNSTLESANRLRMILLVVFAALAVVGLRYAKLNLKDRRLVDIRKLPDSVLVSGFSLSSERELQIDIMGAAVHRSPTADAGTVLASLENVRLIDLRTREVVWDVRDVQDGRRSDETLSYVGTIFLTEGEYLLFCSVRNGEPRNQNTTWVSWLDSERETQGADSESSVASDGFHITVMGKGRRMSSSEVIAALEEPAENTDRDDTPQPSRPERNRALRPESSGTGSGAVLVDLTRLEDDEAKFGHFSLSRTTDVRVYAVGEGMDGEMYDYGWIVNTANGRTVWEMEYRNTEHAGGDRKNRLVDATISLRRGNYVVYFVTDDSHSYDDWNARAPYDEEAWGILVAESNRSRDGSREGARGDSRWTEVARLTGIRDDVRRRTYFTLDRRARVRVYALGEGDRNEMYDYAWLEDADSRSTIWEMNYRNSEHAGGASKNRMVDSTGWLPAGEYILRYESDGSHSPQSWNDDPPRDRRNYGVTVFVERP